MPPGPRIREGHLVLQFVCENAVVLAIVGALTSMAVTLGYAVLQMASRYVY